LRTFVADAERAAKTETQSRVEAQSADEPLTDPREAVLGRVRT
jgi:hypothetical protein